MATERSRCHPALPGSARGQAFADAAGGLVGGERLGESPWATSTSPILLWLTERSRCHPALPGSARGEAFADAASGLVGGERLGQVALGDAARRRSYRG